MQPTPCLPKSFAPNSKVQKMVEKSVQDVSSDLFLSGWIWVSESLHLLFLQGFGTFKSPKSMTKTTEDCSVMWDFGFVTILWVDVLRRGCSTIAVRWKQCESRIYQCCVKTNASPKGLDWHAKCLALVCISLVCTDVLLVTVDMHSSWVNSIFWCDAIYSTAMPCKLNRGSSYKQKNSFLNSHYSVTMENLTSLISSFISRLHFEPPGENKTYAMKQTPKSSRFHICHPAKIKELFSFQQSPARLIASPTNTYPMKHGNQSMITDKWWKLKCVTDLNSCSIC